MHLFNPVNPVNPVHLFILLQHGLGIGAESFQERRFLFQFGERLDNLAVLHVAVNVHEEDKRLVHIFILPLISFRVKFSLEETKYPHAPFPGAIPDE